MRHSLRLMRRPARAAGLGELQRFLERGFETFRGLPDARAFLCGIALREREMVVRLFGAGAPAMVVSGGPLSKQLP